MDTPTTLRTPTDDEIPGLLEQQAASGMTMAAFARERGLSTWKLYPAARRKTDRQPRRKAKAVPAGFAPVSVIGGLQGFELDLGSRGVVRIPAGFDSAGLRRLLEVLRAC